MEIERNTRKFKEYNITSAHRFYVDTRVTPSKNYSFSESEDFEYQVRALKQPQEVDETQNTENKDYLIDLNLTCEERTIYSIVLFVISLIINIIFVSIFDINVGINILLNMIYILLNSGIICLTFKRNYLEKVKNNLILVILLIIFIIFDIIFSVNNNENNLTLIFIFIIKTVIIGYYIKCNL